MVDRQETLPLTDFALKKPSLVLALLCVAVVLGIFSYSRLGADLFPPVNFPLVSVMMKDPGASADEVTRRLTTPIENALSVLPHIQHVHSTVFPGVTIVTAVFDDSVLGGGGPERQVREAMARIAATLPAGLSPPEITRDNPTRLPLMWIIIPISEQSGLHDESEEVSFVKNGLVTSLLKVPGVRSAGILAPPPRVVHVYVRWKSLKTFHLSLGGMASQLKEASEEYPAGFLSYGQRFMSLETGGKTLSMASLPAFPILLPSGKTLPLGSIANITTGSRHPDYLFRFDGKKAIAVKVYASRGADLVSLARKIRGMLVPALSRQNAPPGFSGSRSFPTNLKATIRMDRSLPVERNNRELLETLILGAILAVFVIFMFLGNIRETAVASVAIPASILATFPLLLAAHFTLNNLTMLGLSLVVGILIDDAIVVLENINRHRMMGETPFQSARFGVGEIGRAVLATTFSIVAVFVPMAMMHGVLGEFFTEFGWTVSFAVMTSLLISLSVSPILMIYGVGHDGRQEHRHLFPRLASFGHALRERYGHMLYWSMNHSWSLAGISGGMLFGTLLLGSHLGWNLIPDEDQGAYVVHMSLSGSPSIERTDGIATDLSKRIEAMSGVLSVFHEVGGGKGASPSEGYVYVNLVDRSKRTSSNLEYIENTRKILSTFPGISASVDTISPLGGTGASAQFQCYLLGPDPGVLDRLSKEGIVFLKTLGGLRDLQTSSSGSSNSFLITPAAGNLPQWRISPARLAQWVSSMTTGQSAGRIETAVGPQDLDVSLDPSDVGSPERLSELPFPITPTRTLPLRDIATIVINQVPQRLNRDDRTPSITISANIKPPMSLGEAMEKMGEWSQARLPAGYSLRFAGNSDVLNDARTQISWVLLVAILVVFTVLSFQFDSFILPFVIMISIPFSVVGAVLGLWISGIPVNIMSAIGLVILFGLVTKNAILLVDYANTLRRKGRSIRDAALESARVRLRPIAMTTFAMISGMLPMAVGWGAGGTIRESMAVVVIGGLISSMFFTLFLVPVVYERVAKYGKMTIDREES